MAQNSQIQHAANYPYIQVRLEYAVLCDNDLCAAMVLDLFEFYSNSASAKAGDGTFSERVSTMGRDLFGLYAASSIRSAIKKLRDKGFIEIDGHKGEGSPNEYRLLPEAINEAIKTTCSGAKNRFDALDSKLCKAKGGVIKNYQGGLSKFDKGGCQNLTVPIRNKETKETKETASEPQTVRSQPKNSPFLSREKEFRNPEIVQESFELTPEPHPVPATPPQRRQMSDAPDGYLDSDFKLLRLGLENCARAEGRFEQLNSPPRAVLRDIMIAANRHPVETIVAFVRDQFNRGRLKGIERWSAIPGRYCMQIAPVFKSPPRERPAARPPIPGEQPAPANDQAAFIEWANREGYLLHLGSQMQAAQSKWELKKAAEAAPGSSVDIEEWLDKALDTNRSKVA